MAEHDGSAPGLRRSGTVSVRRSRRRTACGRPPRRRDRPRVPRHGFFYVVGHGVPADGAGVASTALAREFFAWPDVEKAAIAMARGGRAWRGWFPVGGELTSGAPDLKEGLYFGQELRPDDPRSCAGLPLHGPNLFPATGRRGCATRCSSTSTPSPRSGTGCCAASRARSGSTTRGSTATSPPTRSCCSASSTTRRCPATRGRRWSVGEHTDYGLHHDPRPRTRSGGLEVRGRDGWIAAPPIPDAFVVNLGDMLERMTGGGYRSTPHRVRNTTGRRSPLVPAVPRPGVGRRGAPILRPRPPVFAGSGGDRPVGRRQRPRLVRHLRRLPAHQGGEGLPHLLDEVLPTNTPGPRTASLLRLTLAQSSR